MSVPPAGVESTENVSNSRESNMGGGAKHYHGFVHLSLDILLNILYHMQCLDILNVKLSCRALATATKYRSVWTHALENALEMQRIPIQSYKDVLEHAPISTLMGMSSIPGRLDRKLRLGGTLDPYAKYKIYPPEGHDVESYRASPDGRILVVCSRRPTEDEDDPRTVSIWDLGVDGGQLPVLRLRTELPQGASLLPHVGQGRQVAEDRCALIYLSMSPSDASASRPGVNINKYDYETSQMELMDTLAGVSQNATFQTFGSTIFYLRHRRCYLLDSDDDMEYSLSHFDLPNEWMAPIEGVYVSERNILLAKAGYAIFPRSVPRSGNDCRQHATLSLKDIAGTTNEFPAMTPLRQSGLPIERQAKFFVEVSKVQSKPIFRWSTFSEININGAPVDCLPTFAGSTILPDHHLTRGSVSPWGTGFIATVQSPLSAVMVDGKDLQKAHSLQLNVAEELIDTHTAFLPIHGTVYMLSTECTGIIVYQLFRPPPPFIGNL